MKLRPEARAAQQVPKKLLLWVTGELVPISSSLWARGRVHPGQVASPSQGNTQTTMHTLIHTPKGNLELPINLTGMSLDCGRKPEYLVRGRGLAVRTRSSQAECLSLRLCSLLLSVGWLLCALSVQHKDTKRGEIRQSMRATREKAEGYQRSRTVRV
ncbi:hypothetical protein AMECASPLE_015849 [Ameca splendens]|uniref:Uncharacterized protein n=1 Tax=Ameca splendens TaxID=208324 RepID=A0ABV0Y1W7_9TELE